MTILIAYFTADLIDAFGGKGKGSGTLFIICGGFTAMCGIFCLTILKETKGLTEQEVATLYSQERKVDPQIEGSSLLEKA